jgi:hypothetical protein
MRKHAYSYPFVLAVVLAALFVATNGRAATQPSWAEVSSFYSGGNFTGPIDCTWTNSNGTTGFAGSGHIALNPQVCKSLAALRRYGPRSQQGMVLGALGLSVLIHESLHNRIQPGWDASDEIVIGDLGVRLMPDAVNRFWGVRPDSPWGRKWRAMVLKQLAPIG